MPGIEIQDISLEENTQLFEKLVQGFGKLGVVPKLLNHKSPPPLPWYSFKIDLFWVSGEHFILCISIFIYNNKLVKINYWFAPSHARILNHKHPRIHKLINSFACIRDKSQDQPRFIQTKPDWSNKTGLIQIKSD